MTQQLNRQEKALCAIEAYIDTLEEEPANLKDKLNYLGDAIARLIVLRTLLEGTADEPAPERPPLEDEVATHMGWYTHGDGFSDGLASL